MTLPTADWLAALSEMDEAVASALVALDGFEARWPDTPVAQCALTADTMDARLSGWDERLIAASRLAEELERDFAASATALGQWGKAYTGWRERIQQTTVQPI